MKNDIKTVLDLHIKWIKEDPKGECADLRGADLRCVNLTEANLSGADLFGADLTGANLTGANLSDVDLSTAILPHADLFGADLTGANLTGANLYNVDLHRANLRDANLTRANLFLTDLHCADLSGANLSDANLYGAKGNLLEIKSLLLEKYLVVYTYNRLQIGCENYSISDWWGFDDKRILEIKGKEGLEWWWKFKTILQNIIQTTPAKPTGKEPKA